MSHQSPEHFKGQSAYEHVLQKKSEIASEIHGEELPGHLGAFLDATRDMAVLLILLSILAFILQFSIVQTAFLLISAGLMWTAWKTIRSAWFNWTLLERLHRVLKEERYEIENHREQEREELTALYASKGFQGELLEDVIDVLMADDERLLRVMMEEEMGLNLEHYEHPLKIAAGSLLGSLITAGLMIGSMYLLSFIALIACGAVLKVIAGLIMARMQRNDWVSALVWNVSSTGVVIIVSYFLFNWMKPLFV